MQFTADSLKKAAISAIQHASDGVESAKHTMAKAVGVQLDSRPPAKRGGGGRRM